MPDPPPFSPGQPPAPPGPGSYGPPQGQGPIPGQSQPPVYHQGYPPGTQFVAGQPVQFLQAVGAPSNGIGTAGGVVGIVAICLFWIPYIGLVLGIIAVALSGTGLSRANSLGGAGKGMSVTGLVCGAVALVINILFIVAVYNTVHSL